MHLLKRQSAGFRVVIFLAGTFRLFVVIEREPTTYLNVAEVVAHIHQIPYRLVRLGGSHRNAYLGFLRHPRHYTKPLHHPCALFCFHAFSFGLGICLDCVCDTTPCLFEYSGFRLVRLLEVQFFRPVPGRAAANAVSCGYLPGRRIRVFPNCYFFQPSLVAVDVRLLHVRFFLVKKIMCAILTNSTHNYSLNNIH